MGPSGHRNLSIALNNTPSLGVVGLGRMAQALLFPLLEAGLVEGAGVRAVVASGASAARLAEAHGLAVGTDPAAAWAAPVVLLAVKPQQLDQVAQAASAGQQGLLISVLAGVKLERLQRLFPAWHCVRAVPNTPSLVRAGLTGLAFGPRVSSAQRAWVETLFGLVGEVHELPEAQLDAFWPSPHRGRPLWPWWPRAWRMGPWRPGCPAAWPIGWPTAPWPEQQPYWMGKISIQASSRTW